MTSSKILATACTCKQPLQKTVHTCRQPLHHMWSFFGSSVLETVSICNVLFNVLSSQPPSFHCFSLFQCSWHVILLLIIISNCLHLQAATKKDCPHMQTASSRHMILLLIISFGNYFHLQCFAQCLILPTSLFPLISLFHYHQSNFLFTNIWASQPPSFHLFLFFIHVNQCLDFT